MAEYRGIKAILRQFYVLIKQKLDSIKVDADHFEGTLPVAKGGTGATGGQDAFENIASGVRTSSAPADSETMLFRSTSWHKTTVADFWNYIKGKIAAGWNWNPSANITMTPTANNQEWSFDFSNKSGKTGSYWHVWDESKNTLLKVEADSGKVSAPYGFVGSLTGKASTAGTADKANAIAHRGSIANTGTFQAAMNNDGKWNVTDLNSGWSGMLLSFYCSGSRSGLLFRIKGGSSDIRNVEFAYTIDSNRFADGPWTPLVGRVPITAPSSPQNGDIWIE